MSAATKLLHSTTRPLSSPRIRSEINKNEFRRLAWACQESWELSRASSTRSVRNVAARGTKTNFSRSWSADILQQLPRSEVQLTEFLAFKASLDQLIFVVDQHIDGSCNDNTASYNNPVRKVWRRVDDREPQDGDTNQWSPPTNGDSVQKGSREEETAASPSRNVRKRQFLSSVQLCTIFHRLAKYGTQLKPRRQRELRENATVVWLAAEIERLVKEGVYQGQALANIAWYVARGVSFAGGRWPPAGSNKHRSGFS